MVQPPSVPTAVYPLFTWITTNSLRSSSEMRTNSIHAQPPQHTSPSHRAKPTPSPTAHVHQGAMSGGSTGTSLVRRALDISLSPRASTGTPMTGVGGEIFGQRTETPCLQKPPEPEPTITNIATIQPFTKTPAFGCIHGSLSMKPSLALKQAVRHRHQPSGSPHQLSLPFFHKPFHPT